MEATQERNISSEGGGGGEAEWEGSQCRRYQVRHPQRKTTQSDVGTSKVNLVQNHLRAVEPPKPVAVINVGLPSSPPLPDEDNEEAMGNLGLEDSEEVEDQSMRMPEDVASYSAMQDSAAARRKPEEVADSEDEVEIEVAIGTAARLSSTPKVQGGFLPSSQLDPGDVDDSKSRPRRPTTGREEDHVGNDQEDEMLLQN